MPDQDLVPLTLVPVEVFGGCDHPRTADHNPDMCDLWGYGLSDAVSVWSDCNRATGRIYRVDDLDSPREPGESIQIWAPREALPWFEKRWGTP